MPVQSKDQTLVVVLCETRAHRLTFDSFNKNLLQPFSADLALCVAEHDLEDTQNPFYQKASYVWSAPEADEWGGALEAIVPNHHPEWRRITEVPGNWLAGVAMATPQRGSGAVQLYFRTLLRERLRSTGLIAQYDRFIITRSDFVYPVSHLPPELLDEQFIWMPNGEDYGGIMDRHVVCSAEHVDQFLSLGDLLTRDPDEVIEDMASQASWNCEQVLWKHLQDTGLSKLVRRFPYGMYAVREPQGTTNWSAGTYNDEIGAYIKYPLEFWRAKLATWILGKREWSRIRWTLFEAIDALHSQAHRLRRRLAGKGNLG